VIGEKRRTLTQARRKINLEGCALLRYSSLSQQFKSRKVLRIDNPHGHVTVNPVSYTHLRSHETEADLECRHRL
jgi:hypothetical protein